MTFGGKERRRVRDSGLHRIASTNQHPCLPGHLVHCVAQRAWGGAELRKASEMVPKRCRSCRTLQNPRPCLPAASFSCGVVSSTTPLNRFLSLTRLVLRS